MSPTTKVFYNGKLIKPRTVQGKFTTSRLSRAWSYFYRMFLITTGALVLSASLIAIGIASATPPPIVHAEAPTDHFEEKLDTLKAAIVHDLAYKCESPGYKKGDDAIIWDTNNRASVGPFKFQIETYQMYTKIFSGRVLNDVQAVTEAMDYDLSAALATKIIFEDKGKGANNWWNCTNRKDLNLRARVAAVKSLN